ncbi:Uncharacterised protein [Mycobacteroides abscessus subsp. abscessus]|nr:Uncharacterised protein [Mycobacteroides abscessus subsp. abscessus]
MVEADLGAERLEPGLVHVETARADRIAAGQGDVGGAHPRGQRAEDGDRGPHRADEFVVGLDPHRGGDVDAHGAGVGIVVDGAAEAAEEFDHDPHVEDRGNVGDRRASHSEQARRHELEDAVLRAPDVDGAAQLRRTGQAEDFHQVNRPIVGLKPGGEDSSHEAIVDRDSVSIARETERGLPFAFP